MSVTFPAVFCDVGLEDQEAYLYADVNYLDLSDNTHKDITQAVCSSIAWVVTVKETGAAVANGTFTVSDVVFDTPIEYDGVSYNFRGRFAGTCFPSPATRYAVRVTISLTGTPTDTTRIDATYTTRA